MGNMFCLYNLFWNCPYNYKHKGVRYIEIGKYVIIESDVEKVKFLKPGIVDAGLSKKTPDHCFSENQNIT